MHNEKITKIEEFQNNYPARLKLDQGEVQYLLKMNSSQSVTTYLNNKLKWQRLHDNAIFIQRILRRVLYKKFYHQIELLQNQAAIKIQRYWKTVYYERILPNMWRQL